MLFRAAGVRRGVPFRVPSECRGEIGQAEHFSGQEGVNFPSSPRRHRGRVISLFDGLPAFEVAERHARQAHLGVWGLTSLATRLDPSGGSPRTTKPSASRTADGVPVSPQSPGDLRVPLGGADTISRRDREVIPSGRRMSQLECPSCKLKIQALGAPASCPRCLVRKGDAASYSLSTRRSLSRPRRSIPRSTMVPTAAPSSAPPRR